LKAREQESSRLQHELNDCKYESFLSMNFSWFARLIICLFAQHIQNQPPIRRSHEVDILTIKVQMQDTMQEYIKQKVHTSVKLQKSCAQYFFYTWRFIQFECCFHLFLIRRWSIHNSSSCVNVLWITRPTSNDWNRFVLDFCASFVCMQIRR
jgi:hypothetical protein